MRAPPKAAINSYATRKKLPGSVIKWIDSEEGQASISAAIGKAAIESESFERSCVVPSHLLDKPFDDFTKI
ncbi:hypothetical protein RYA05_03065 [Pseudomonas syringae pv. actinidiae]|nr:hypothetical protein [Pseudomonas syringae pv. actinidiae]